MPKTADYIFTVDDIEDEYYDRNCGKTNLSFLAPMEVVDEFMMMCTHHEKYPWEMLEVLMIIARNREVIQIRMK